MSDKASWSLSIGSAYVCMCSGRVGLSAPPPPPSSPHTHTRPLASLCSLNRLLGFKRGNSRCSIWSQGEGGRGRGRVPGREESERANMLVTVGGTDRFLSSVRGAYRCGPFQIKVVVLNEALFIFFIPYCVTPLIKDVRHSS